jgi:hypothetical protein
VSVPHDLHALVRERFNARCGYCGVHEDDVGATLTVDHHHPLARGGTSDATNLVYCCARCNEHKGVYWNERDLQYIRLLHPGKDDLTLHLLVLDDSRIDGVTSEGEFFVQRLRLNRPQLVAYRRARWLEEERRAEVIATRKRLDELEHTVGELRTALETTAAEIERHLKVRS